MVFQCTAYLIGLEENGVSDGQAGLRPKSSVSERLDRGERPERSAPTAKRKYPWGAKRHERSEFVPMAKSHLGNLFAKACAVDGEIHSKILPRFAHSAPQEYSIAVLTAPRQSLC